MTKYLPAFIGAFVGVYGGLKVAEYLIDTDWVNRSMSLMSATIGNHTEVCIAAICGILFVVAAMDNGEN